MTNGEPLQVVRVHVSGKAYGGNAYERDLDRVLESINSIRVRHLGPRTASSSKLLLGIKFVQTDALAHGAPRSELVIRPFQACLLFPLSARDVILVHHVDETLSPLLSKAHQHLSKARLLLSLKDQPHIVVVSNYWRNWFADRGFKNVHLIHNAFAIDQYRVSPEEVQDFLVRHGLNGIKIAYCGNPQLKKGIDLVAAGLRGTGLELCTSGIGTPFPGVRHLDLSFRDYLCLLRASSVVVTMSRFREGWCRVAHEAMLMGTPVVGSGSGGMAELLQGGGQVVCADPKDLRQTVRHAIENRSSFSARGLEFARSFSMARFASSWNDLFETLRLSGARGTARG